MIISSRRMTTFGMLCVRLDKWGPTPPSAIFCLHVPRGPWGANDKPVRAAAALGLRSASPGRAPLGTGLVGFNHPLVHLNQPDWRRSA